MLHCQPLQQACPPTLSSLQTYWELLSTQPCSDEAYPKPSQSMRQRAEAGARLHFEPELVGGILVAGHALAQHLQPHLRVHALAARVPAVVAQGAEHEEAPAQQGDTGQQQGLGQLDTLGGRAAVSRPQVSSCIEHELKLRCDVGRTLGTGCSGRCPPGQAPGSAGSRSGRSWCRGPAAGSGPRPAAPPPRSSAQPAAAGRNGRRHHHMETDELCTITLGSGLLTYNPIWHSSQHRCDCRCPMS